MASADRSLLIALAILAVAAIICTLILLRRYHHIKVKLKTLSETLDDIAAGNSNRRLLAHPDEEISGLCYKINDIVQHYRDQIIGFKTAEETNRQLMTSLSHDVRTPLTTLIGYLDAAQKGIVSGSERESYIETARERAHTMKDYVDMLFEWFKLNSGEETFQRQPLDLAESCRELLKDWIPIFETQPFAYDIEMPEAPMPVCIDADALRRILNNLIQNVLRHSQATRIEIRVGSRDGFAELSVTDNGRGIAPQDLPHIFERLYKGDKARSEQGSGLGLSIVQQLVRKMGGMISAQSEPSVRTEFRMRFPLSPE